MRELVLLYTCDLCGKNHTDENDVSTIRVSSEEFGHPTEIDFCNDSCSEKILKMSLQKLLERGHNAPSIEAPAKRSGGAKATVNPKEPCPICCKKVTARGLSRHMSTTHPEE